MSDFMTHSGHSPKEETNDKFTTQFAANAVVDPSVFSKLLRRNNFTK